MPGVRLVRVRGWSTAVSACLFAAACSLSEPQLAEREDGGGSGGTSASGGEGNGGDGPGTGARSSGGTASGGGAAGGAGGGDGDGGRSETPDGGTDSGASGTGGTGGTDGGAGAGGSVATGGSPGSGGSGAGGATVTAHRLAFEVEPTGGAAAQALPAFRVAVKDGQGLTVTSAALSITVSLDAVSNPAQLALTGTLTAGTTNGVATFSNVVVDRSGTTLRLRADAAGATSALSAAFDTVAWRAAGPDGGNPWRVVAGTGTDVYAVFQRGTKIYRSTNGGASWTAAGTGAPAEVDAFAVNPSDPAKVYLGGPECYRSDDGGQSFVPATAGMTPTSCKVLVAQGSVVYAAADTIVHRSTNDGASWTRVTPDAKVGAIASLAPDPLTPATLYAGGRLGVAKSTDSGATWTPINQGLPANPEALALAVHPATPSIVYAATIWGLFRSSNGGAQWTHLTAGLPSSTLNGNPRYLSFHVAVDPADPSVVYTVANGTANSGVYRSGDGGTSWTLVRGGAMRWVSVHPSNRFAYFSSNGVARRDGNGTITVSATGMHRSSTYWGLKAHPSTPGTVLVASEAGVLRTTNGGGSWTIGSPETAAYRGFAFVPGSTADVFAVDGERAVVRSVDGGSNWTRIQPQGGLRPDAALLVTKASPLTLMSASGELVESSDGGATFTAVCGGGPRCTGAQIGFYALLADPMTPGTLYAGGGMSWGEFARSVDNGQRWEQRGTESGQLLAVDANGRVYASASTGLQRSTSGADAWLPVGDRRDIRFLHPDRKTPTTLYAVDLASTVAKSSNDGASWKNAGTGLPDGITITGLDADGAGRLYVTSTEHGVYESWSAGE